MVAITAAAATSPWWLTPAANTLGIGGMMLWNYLNKNNFLPSVPTQDLFPSNQDIQWRDGSVTDSNFNVITPPVTQDVEIPKVNADDVLSPDIDVASPPPPPQQPKKQQYDPGDTARIDALFRAKDKISQPAAIDPQTLTPTQKALEKYGFNSDEYELVPGTDGNYKVVRKAPAIPTVNGSQRGGSIPPDGIGTKESPYIVQAGDPRFTTGSGTKEDPWITQDRRAWNQYQQSLPPESRAPVTYPGTSSKTSSSKTGAIVDAFLETMDILGY